jgi:hypothetical protein
MFYKAQFTADIDTGINFSDEYYNYKVSNLVHFGYVDNFPLAKLYAFVSLNIGKLELLLTALKHRAVGV